MSDGIPCPECNGPTRVVYTRNRRRCIVRRRQCRDDGCAVRLTTAEREVGHASPDMDAPERLAQEIAERLREELLTAAAARR